ncbi:MAG: hypothetical protein FWF90_15590 [Promicromonosporaceae bacterium]|nr:hypothetical protein [Promicromonosporaceae bacterium]
MGDRVKVFAIGYGHLGWARVLDTPMGGFAFVQYEDTWQRGAIAYQNVADVDRVVDYVLA